MNREIHVRFCEGLRVRFPWATHLRSFKIGQIPEGLNDRFGRDAP
jgi:hypothetical protein